MDGGVRWAWDGGVLGDELSDVIAGCRGWAREADGREGGIGGCILLFAGWAEWISFDVALRAS